MENKNENKGVSFDNLRTLSQINNKDLFRMDKDVKGLLVQLESVSKNIHEQIKKTVEPPIPVIKAMDKEPIVEQSAKVEVKKPEESPKTEVKQWQRKDDTRPVPSHSDRPNNNFDKNRRPPFNQQSTYRPQGSYNNQQGNYNNQQQGGYRPQSTYNNQQQGGYRPQGSYNNQQQGGYRPQGNYNNQQGTSYNRPQGTYNNQQGTRPPFQNNMQRNARPPFLRAHKEDATEIIKPPFPLTQKRVFDKKKDNEKRNRDINRLGAKNKHDISRQGLVEELYITERIMGSRRIKKKQKIEETVISAPIDHAIISTETITVKQLSEKTGRSVSEILKQLMVLGIVSNVNSVIDFVTAELVSSELGVVLEQKFEKTSEEKLADAFAPEISKDNDTKGYVSRPPIVAVLGHVDHGKTSLLDYIRSAHIASGEAGGITQHISAYQIETNGKKITFIDTPGHEAFSAMRERGASVTDIAILVIAGDDGIKPQTIEAIKHIKNAKVPMIVAVNKMDKPEFNLERVKQQLTENDIVPEEWGGDTVVVPVSAVTGEGVKKLIEMILLVADMQELKADPTAKALGMIIESKLDKGKGPIATMIVLNGTLKVGDTVISGVHAGKVRALISDSGTNIKKALPSTPVAILGLDGLPNVGDNIYAVDEKMSKEVLAERKRKVQTDKIKSKAQFSIEDFLAKDASNEKKVLNVIVKADVQGAFEALVAMLNKVQNEEVKVECIHGGVGTINENDVLLAQSSNALLVGFNVKPDSKASIIVEHQKIPAFISKIIYQIVEHIEKIIKGMRKPVFEEKIMGHAEVIRIFKISRIGTIAGCIVKDGKISKNCKIRLYREKKLLVDTSITTLQKDKNDVKEVSAGMECGMKLEGHNDILVGDVVESYVIEQIEQD